MKKAETREGEDGPVVKSSTCAGHGGPYLLIPTLRRQRQPDFEVKVSMVYTVSSRSASPSYIVRTYLKITLTKTKKCTEFN